MKKKAEYQGYLIKVDFVGDSITPIYRFRLYRKRKNWFPQFLWQEELHVRDFRSRTEGYGITIRKYKEHLERWSK